MHAARFCPLALHTFSCRFLLGTRSACALYSANVTEILCTRFMLIMCVVDFLSYKKCVPCGHLRKEIIFSSFESNQKPTQRKNVRTWKRWQSSLQGQVALIQSRSSVPGRSYSQTAAQGKLRNSCRCRRAGLLGRCARVLER
jgi:hypothetical protein